MERLSLDEEAPQRARKKDKTPSDDVPAGYEPEGHEPSGYAPLEDKSISEIEKLVKRLGGLVVSMEYTKDGYLLRYITIGIPREQINEFMNGLRELGEIKGKTEELQYEGNMILFSIELSIEG
jgi:hypothetical protein